ncbi:MAG: tol-pal system-associated acyl-CoA thioesterase [Porticoccaceae bacterium]|nr:MAG: tol-pal system-associated acyl-CoA thioesterase [Porticoccaceae bacterium]
MTEEYCLPIRVYVEDTDAGGIVYYANYLKYIERARTELIRTLGYDKPALFNGLLFVVHSVEIKYRKPAVLDDEILATAKLIKVSRTSFTIAQRVLRGGDVLVDAEVKVACIDQETKRPAGIPSDMLQALKAAL